MFETHPTTTQSLTTSAPACPPAPAPALSHALQDGVFSTCQKITGQSQTITIWKERPPTSTGIVTVYTRSMDCSDRFHVSVSLDVDAVYHCNADRLRLCRLQHSRHNVNVSEAGSFPGYDRNVIDSTEDSSMSRCVFECGCTNYQCSDNGLWYVRIAQPHTGWICEISLDLVY